MDYKKINNIVGWLMFAIAAFTYISTVEPTASLWDCSEFITSAFKLEVGHPPGAPLFAMLGHLFTMWVSPDKAALAVNIFSALCSAFTILFLFWSITRLVRRFSAFSGEMTFAQTLTVIACGIVGSLVYTFSDTFWFSAVEGEVYAASSLITAIVFWAILKWEGEADAEYSTRWLILIAYITGLSIGVHLLNLLVVPTIVFVYYFKKYKVTNAGIIKTAIVSVILLGIVLWGIIPGAPKIASWFEVLFVNSFSLPVNSGLMFFVILLISGLSYAVYYTHKKGNRLANAIFLALSFCMLGYGSYAMIVIRSSADTPMNQNKPDNIFSLIYYLNRDQYGAAPLLTGPYYTNAGEGEMAEKEEYVLLNGKYVKQKFHSVKYKKTYFFPRMWSNRRPGQDQVYKLYTSGANPTFADNLHFFFDYQLGFMYWRYFMWNFVGRQNDMQASINDPTRGNWISGIDFIDENRLGPLENLPKYMSENKGHNKYYFLPLILGLLGLFYQFKKDKKGFTVVTLLFIFTGIAIIVYLNQAPNEPRERDYAYAGSFYAFAIWIGMGIALIVRLLSKILKEKTSAIAALILGLPVPALMAQQNWDDHDRSGRYITTDYGYNYLISCDRNAILYTHGDNDTFAIWYNQEVEGVRTDVKIINTQYIYSDWYYAQMKKRSYEAAPLKTIATYEKVIGETRQFVHTLKYFGKENLQYPSLDLKKALEYVFDDRPSTQVKYGNNHYNVFPSINLRLPVDKDEVIRLGLVKDTSAIVPYIEFKIPEPAASIGQIASLDFAANNFPERPIYYGAGGDNEFFMGINDNLRYEGMMYRMVPENTKNDPIDIDKTFDLLMNKFRYRGLNDSDVYHDECSKRMILICYRNAFVFLANCFQIQQDSVRLRRLMEKYHEVMPEFGLSNILEQPYSRVINPFVDFYFEAGLNDYAISLAQRVIDEYRKEYDYYLKQNARKVAVNTQLSRVYQGVKGLNDILTDFKPVLIENNCVELQTQTEELFKEMGTAVLK